MESIVAQTVGVIAYAVLMLSYQMQKKSQMLLLQVFSSIAFAIHYYLLGGISATVCNALSVFVLFSIFYFEKKNYKKIFLAVIMAPILVVIAFLTYENLYSVLPIIASLLILVGFLLKSENKIRVVGIVGCILWLMYGIIYRSYPAMVFETVIIIATFIAIVRSKKSKGRVKIAEGKKSKARVKATESKKNKRRSILRGGG